jgi:tRNA G18 (ribose-2'-O)-methylase SpoU
MSRNVIDFFKYWNEEAIKASLDTKRHNFSVVCQNIERDFNIGSVIRNANAFLAKEVIIYGSKKWDRRGSVGTHHYENISYIKSIDELIPILKDKIVISIDNVPQAKPIESYKYDSNKHYVFIFGEENAGVSKEIQSISDEILYISQYGSVRSLNVGCASSITMYDYLLKINKQ